jgi:hypothetical protein
MGLAPLTPHRGYGILGAQAARLHDSVGKHHLLPEPLRHLLPEPLRLCAFARDLARWTFPTESSQRRELLLA